MADEITEKLKETWLQKLLFYTTAFFILLGVFSLFAFLFLVPFVIDPAFTTIFMQFEEKPALCVTVSTVTNRGASNCTWSSCKEGCTKELYECTQILVSYKFDEDTNVISDENAMDTSVTRKKRSVIRYSLLKFAQTYRSLFAQNSKKREIRAIRDYDYMTSDFIENEGLQGNNSEWYYVKAKLFPNVKGCGYPPILNCTIFLKTYRTIGTNFTCYFSRVDPSLVINEYDLDQVYMNLIYAMAIPIPSFIISIVYLTFAYFVIYAEDPPPKPGGVSPTTTPVALPASGALTPASEVFREDLASFGHDFKVAMADEPSRESVVTCNDAVPNSNSVPDG
ncbi:hypothetical protein RUM44_013024 [Polyplax serrata]|uniref:Protein tipE n=1 Tax=Polyplax serrata TaxID=468196 RepID=A0ABR1BHC3_POLSC